MRTLLVVACLAASLVAEPAQAQLIGATRAPGAKYMILASKLSGQGKHQEVIREIQPHIDAGEYMPSVVLMMLGTAYYEVRNYRGLLATADVMDRNIAAGDRTLRDDLDLTPYPQLFRIWAALDTGAYEDVIRLGEQLRNHLDAMPASGFSMRAWKRNYYVMLWSPLGVAQAFLGRAAEARKTVESLRASDGDGPLRYDGIARIHMALKEYDKALQAITSSGAQASLLVSFMTSLSWSNQVYLDVPKVFIRAKSLYETGALAEAKKAYDDLLKLPQLFQFGGVYWVTLQDRARIAVREGDTSDAIDRLKKSVEAIEAQRSSIDSEAGRMGFVGDKQAVYQQLIAILVQVGDATGALGYVERAKARALVDMLAGKKDFSAPAGSAERVGELLAAAELPDAGARDLESPAQASLAKRSAALARRMELARAAPELSSLVTVSAADASTVQALLLPDETLVEYFYAGDELYAFVASRDTVTATRLDGKGLEADVLAFRKAIQAPDSARWTQPAKNLHERLIAPLRERLRTPNLLIVGHGALHYLPFNALHDGSAFLVEAYAVRLLPAATVLKFLKADAAQKPGTLLAFGNPDLGDQRFDLPFAEKEAEDVAKTMPRSRALVRRDASRAAFRKYSSDFRFIHVASHGEFDAERPLVSSLLLAPDGGDDGRLTVSDLYSMRVDADLVTLSACETGLGKVANGDDVVGLTRGFLYAGARTIVASLWQVDDRATSELMSAFYSSLGKGLTRREALSAAEREQLKKQPHPFFWAAFQLTGSP